MSQLIVTDSKQYFDFIWTCVHGGCYWDDFYGSQTMIEGIDYPKQPYPGVPPQNNHQYYGYPDSVYVTGVVGMPYAWTGEYDLNRDGFADPDDSDYCFVGFETTSPFLMNDVPAIWTSTGLAYGFFPAYFYEYALGYHTYMNHMPIDQSLDFAAEETFGEDEYGAPFTFATSILNQGTWFYTDMEGMEGWWYWRMRVYGNSNIYLP